MVIVMTHYIVACTQIKAKARHHRKLISKKKKLTCPEQDSWSLAPVASALTHYSTKAAQQAGNIKKEMLHKSDDRWTGAQSSVWTCRCTCIYMHVNLWRNISGANCCGISPKEGPCWRWCGGSGLKCGLWTGGCIGIPKLCMRRVGKIVKVCKNGFMLILYTKMHALENYTHNHACKWHYTCIPLELLMTVLQYIYTIYSHPWLLAMRRDANLQPKGTMWKHEMLWGRAHGVVWGRKE